MPLWDFLFDSDQKQRQDIDAVERRAESNAETLQRLAELKGQVTREELSLMIQRLDLADGVEDGRIGPDRSSLAPKCPFCGRPVNPQRETCIYCGQRRPDAEAAPEANSSQARLIRCVRCYNEVREDQAHFSPEGLICDDCQQSENA